MQEPCRFGVLFKQISLAFDASLQHEATKYDLTSSQARMLIYLMKANHPVNQRELELFYHLSNPTVTGLMKRMEGKGFITRETSYEDARSKNIILTDKAREISGEVLLNLKKKEKCILQGLSEEEQRTLRNLLDRVLDGLSVCKEE